MQSIVATFGPAVTSAATSVGPGRISKLPTLPPAELSHAGGQIGCDYQWNAWVFGFRNMLDGTSLSNSRAFADTSTHWFDTLTARGGYLVTPQVLLYVQGGAAWTRACLQLGGLRTRTDQNQTLNAVL